MTERIQFNVRLDRHLYAAIRSKADQEGLSLSNFAIRIFQQALGWETEQPTRTDLQEMLAEMLAPMQQRLEELERQVGESEA